MIRMVFINLPVHDLRIARQFYTQLGFSLNEQSSDGQTVCVMLSDNIVLMLRDTDRFNQLTAQSNADAARAVTVLNSLEVESRRLVDEIAERAEASGAEATPPVADDFSYVRGFSDPDGNRWQVMFMEPRHIIN